MLHRLLLAAGSWEVAVIRCVGTAQCVWQWQQQAGVFPGVREHQHVVFGHNALLCGALEVSEAAGGVCSWRPGSGKPLPPLESEIIVVVCPCLL